MRLALAMGRPLAELADTMSADEFADWLAFHRIFGLPDPWGQAGTIAAAITRPYQKRGTRPVSALDFIPADRQPKSRRQSVHEIRAAMGAVAAVAARAPKRPKPKGVRDGR